MSERMRSPEFDAALATVAAGIAHEVRNPLNAVQINLRILGDELRRLEPDPSADAHGVLARIANEIQCLDNFVAEFLRYARPPRPRLEQVQVKPLVTELVAFMTPECRRKHVTLVLHADKGPPTIVADPFQLKHALLNLILNAQQACERGGRIEIHSGGDAAQLRLVVRDDGPGIKPELLPRVFEAFVTTREGGTGLGLPIARRIIEDHGGTLTITSPSGGGVEAVLSLPVAGVKVAP